MIEYEILGGGTITASSTEEIIEALRRSSFTPEKTIEDFMESMASACKTQTGAIISTYNQDEFVTDLAANGFLKKVS